MRFELFAFEFFRRTTVEAPNPYFFSPFASRNDSTVLKALKNSGLPENESGLTGSFEAPVIVPELKQSPVKVSSVVLSTQVEPANRGRSDNPLIRDGLQLLPNLTHVVSREQKLFFYFEVYEPSAEGATTDVRASLAFYRGKVKVLETPVVERTAIDAPERKAAVFRLEVPGEGFKAGLYTCQLNVIDGVAGRFAFPRLVFLVR